MKVITTKKYTIIEKEYEDRSVSFSRHNRGFSTVELLGHIFLVEKEIYESITKGISIPLIIKDEKKNIVDTEERKIIKEVKL